MNYEKVKEKYSDAAKSEAGRKSVVLARIESKQQRIRDLNNEISEINEAGPDFESCQRRFQCFDDINRLTNEIKALEGSNLSDAGKEVVNGVVDNFNI